MAFVNIEGADAPFRLRGVSEQDNYIHGFLDPAGDHEKSFQTFCRNYLPSDAVVLDIGANIGVTSLILSAHVPQGRVHAVEGAKRVFETLESNLAENNITNVEAHRLAISDSNRMVEFVDNSAYGHIADTFDTDKKVDAVEAITLDELVSRLGLSRLDFIKVDIEGHEPQLFAGARNAIEKFDPVILFELNSWAMLVNTTVNPLNFLREVVGKFKYVYRVARDPNDPLGIEPIVADVEATARWLLHDNVVHFGSVNDIVVSNRPLVYTNEQRLRNENKQLLQRIADLEVGSAAREGELATVRAELSDRISELADELTHRDVALAISESQLSALQRELGTQQGEAAVLKEALVAQEAEATALKEALAAQQAEADRLSASLNAEEARTASLTDKVEQLSADLGVCRVRAAALDGSLSWRNMRAMRSSGRLPALPGPTIDDAEFVKGLFRDLLGREADGAGLADYLSRLSSGGSRMNVFADIVASREFKARNSRLRSI